MKFLKKDIPSRLSGAIIIAGGFLLLFSGIIGGRIIERSIAEKEGKASRAAARETDKKISASVFRQELLSGSTSIPLEFWRGVYMGTVHVNGTAGRFLIDTGSTVTIIDPKFAERLKLTARGEELLLETLGRMTIKAPWTIVQSIQVGKARLENFHVVLHTPSGEVDGVLGMDFLGRFVMTISAQKRTLTLALYSSPTP